MFRFSCRGLSQYLRPGPGRGLHRVTARAACVSGAPFDVEVGGSSTPCQVALSPDHRLMRFEPTAPGATPPERVEVARILATEVRLSDIPYGEWRARCVGGGVVTPVYRAGGMGLTWR